MALTSTQFALLTTTQIAGLSGIRSATATSPESSPGATNRQPEAGYRSARLGAPLADVSESA